jgi:hypothetical protein
MVLLYYLQTLIFEGQKKTNLALRYHAYRSEVSFTGSIPLPELVGFPSQALQQNSALHQASFFYPPIPRWPRTREKKQQA